MSEDRLQRAVDALVARYFSPVAPSVELAPGEVLLRAGESNHRLYFVQWGSLLLRSAERTEMRVGPGSLIGIQSVFVTGYTSVWTSIAEERCALSWIDLALPCPSGRPWEVELMPLVVAELNQRQERVRGMEQRQREIEQRLQEMAYISTLGQMAAGVAHELNNALTVLDRGSAWIGPVVTELLATRSPLERQLLEAGLQRHREPPADQAARAAALRARGLAFGEARRLAALPLPRATLDALLDAPERAAALRCFELGATLADMLASARQAAHVVTSLKQLAASERLRDQAVDLGESIEVARSICGSALKGIELELAQQVTEPVQANQGELVQVWTNLIQNACDALHAHPPAAPRIRIETRSVGGEAEVVVADNGPGIDPAIADRIFEPHVTSKQQGLHFGLGLGLSIVRQTLRRYGGSVRASANPGGGARFVVRIPHRPNPTTRWQLERDARRLPEPTEPAP